MMAAASWARSAAVEYCCGFESPVALTKWVFASPRRVDSEFIRSANAASLPATSSASAIAASLPDCTIVPRSSSSTETAFRGSMNIREPSACHAAFETGTICAGLIVLSRSAANIRYAVISLVSDAGSRRSSALSATIPWPLAKSTSRYAGAPIAGGGTAAGTGTGEDTGRASAAQAPIASVAAARKRRPSVKARPSPRVHGKDAHDLAGFLVDDDRHVDVARLHRQEAHCILRLALVREKPPDRRG